MTTTIYIWYTCNRYRKKLMELKETWCSIYMTHPLDIYQTTVFIISSNCLFYGNSDIDYGDKDVHELILVWIFDFQSMPSLS